MSSTRCCKHFAANSAPIPDTCRCRQSCFPQPGDDDGVHALKHLQIELADTLAVRQGHDERKPADVTRNRSGKPRQKRKPVLNVRISEKHLEQAQCRGAAAGRGMEDSAKFIGSNQRINLVGTGPMMRSSIRKQILGIAIGLIVLMAIASVLSTVMARKIAHQLDELTTKYVEAYGHLARMNIRSLEQALALRRIVIGRMQSPPDMAFSADQHKIYETKGQEIEQEAQAARALINAIIDDVSTESDNARLGRIDDRIERVTSDLRRYLGEEYRRLLTLLDAGNFAEARASLARTDTLRDELNQRIEDIRTDMLAQVRSDAVMTMRDQKAAIVISVVLTLLAGILGLVFSLFISTGITGPVRRLLEGTRAVEAGRLDGSIDITTRDEIGQLSAAFNRMVEQLRQN